MGTSNLHNQAKTAHIKMDNFAQTTIAELLIFGTTKAKQPSQKVKCKKCDKVLTKAELTKRYLSKSRSNTSTSTKTQRTNTASSSKLPTYRDGTGTQNSVYSMEYVFWA